METSEWRIFIWSVASKTFLWNAKQSCWNNRNFVKTIQSCHDQIMMTNLQQKMIIPLNIMKQRDCSSISQMHQQKIKLSFLVSWSFKVILFMFQQHQLVKDRGTCYNLGLMEISLPSKYRRIFMWHSNLEMGAQYQNAAIIPGLTASDVCAFPPCRGHQHQNTRNQSIIFIFIRAAAKIFALNGILPKIYLLLISRQRGRLIICCYIG